LISFSIKAATIEEKPVIHVLLQPYLDELSGFPGEVIDYKDVNGIYHYPYLDNFWQEDTRFPYLLYSDDVLAGFALIRKVANHWEMAEFYVKPLFRHIGLARKCVTEILKKHPGTWKIDFNKNNKPGQALWKSIAENNAFGDIIDGKTASGHSFIRFTTSQDQELFAYYNERAPEYEAFYYGKFPTPHPESDIYVNDRQPIQKLLSSYLFGKCLDIACGTGFWLPFYHEKCLSVTLFDQSEKMLAECNKKVRSLGIQDKAHILRGDIFRHAFPGGAYDSALVSFLISHFRNAELDRFLDILRACLVPGGKFVIIDSLWDDEVKSWRHVKAGLNKRSMFDGRSFVIYKRFFAKNDLDKIAKKSNADIQIIYWGRVFFMAVGQFSTGQA
jgi:predicted acetyltransferase/SAM-dependent methyltransferase